MYQLEFKIQRCASQIHATETGLSDLRLTRHLGVNEISPDYKSDVLTSTLYMSAA